MFIGSGLQCGGFSVCLLLGYSESDMKNAMSLSAELI